MTDRKRKIRLEVIFGAIALFLLLSISIPLIISHLGTTSTPSSPSPVHTGLDVPVGKEDYIIGDNEAPVMVVVFTDFQCPSCQLIAELTLPELKETVIKDGIAKVVIKDFPLDGHANAFDAAVTARAAGEQGNYWQMYDRLFENQEQWADLSKDEFADVVRQYALELGLNVEQFQRALQSTHLKEQVHADKRLGEQLGVKQIPTIIVNGSMYEEIITPDDWLFIIEEAMEHVD